MARCGPVELAVREQLTGLPGAKAHPGLAATAIILARKLDEDAGLATAAVARELRASLTELEGEGSADDGVDELLRRLSSPVRNES